MSTLMMARLAAPAEQSRRSRVACAHELTSRQRGRYRGGIEGELMAIAPAQSPATSEVGGTQVTTLLGRGSEFEGKLSFEGTVRVDGKLSGEIFTEGGRGGGGGAGGRAGGGGGAGGGEGM